MHRLRATSLSFFLLVSGLSLGMPAPALALDEADLPSAIENATTPADHEAIAAYYDSEAKAASASAERHRAMAAAYAKPPKSPAGKGVRLSVYRTMAGHCDHLIKDYEAAAHQFEKMAAEHRKAASETQ